MRMRFLTGTFCLTLIFSNTVFARSLVEVVSNGQEFAGHLIHDFDNESPGPIINNNRDILVLGRVFDPVSGDNRNVTFLSNFGFDLKTGATVDDGLTVRFSDEDIAFDMNENGQVATSTELERNGEFHSHGLLVNQDLILLGTETIDGRTIAGIDDRNVRINVQQQVLFHADLALVDSYPLGVFTPNRAVLVEGDRVNDGLIANIGRSFLNDNGEIAASVTLVDNERFAAVLVDGKIVVKQGDVIDGIEVDRFSLEGFNSNGDVLIRSGQFLMTQSKVLLDIPDNRTDFHFYDFNERGDILWRSESALYINNEPIVQIGDSILGGRINLLVDQLSVSMNDFGDVALVSETEPGVEHLLVSVADRDFPHGDFNRDGELTAADIDLLSSQMRTDPDNVDFDVNLDRLLTETDRMQWITQVAKTYVGDSNMDGEFNSSDFVSVFRSDEFEDDVPGNSGWATGDWNGDGEFTSGDFVFALKENGYELGPRTSTGTNDVNPQIQVPEPDFGLLIGWFLYLVSIRSPRFAVTNRATSMHKVDGLCWIGRRKFRGTDV